MARNGWEWPAIAGNGYGLLGVGWNGEEMPGMATDCQELLGIAQTAGTAVSLVRWLAVNRVKSKHIQKTDENA